MRRTLLLASKSPRRRELFSLITPNFLVAEPHVDEGVFDAEKVRTRAVKLACLKAACAAETHPDCAVIGCDTLVELDGKIFGKPRDEQEALDMLSALSGRWHHVYTGVCLLAQRTRHFCCRTSVEFFPLLDGEIKRYAATGDPYDKAGAYGVQGMAACFVRGIRGDYFNVMGLPVSRLYNVLLKENLL